MKRRIFKFCLFLLLGAIINVAVAWGCALVMNPYSGVRSEVFTSTETTLCVAYQYSRSGSIATHCNRSPNPLSSEYSELVKEEDALHQQRKLIPRWSQLYTDLNQPVVEPQCHAVIAWGWPAVSMFGNFSFVNVNAFGSAERCIMLSFKRQKDYRDEASYAWSLLPVILPTGIIIHSFLICSLLYAAIAWLIFALPGGWRRRRRIKRGLCVRCGYPLAPETSAVCSECGTPILRKSVAVHGAVAPCNTCP